jgi:hypothetical protein
MGRLQRVMAVIMSVLTVGFVGLWAYGYFYISAMACAFSNSGNCSVKMPWQLSGEDLQFLVLIPGAVFLGLLTVTVVLWRSLSRNRPET